MMPLAMSHPPAGTPPSTPKRGWLHLATIDITPLRRHRDFRLLFIGRLVSFFGSMITVVAVPYQVYQLSHSVLLVGALGLVELAALIGFAMLGGALADAADRRSMVLLSEVGLMIGSLLLAGNSTLSAPLLWPIFAIAALQGAFDALQRPSLDALLPRLVDRDELPAAAALGSVRGTLGMIAGPALAGVLVAVAGLPVTYLVDVGTFVVGLICLALMRAVPPPVDAERPSIRRVLEGIRYARSRPELIGTYVVDIVAMLFGMPMALFPAIAQGLGGPSVLGLLYAAPAVGSFIFAATSGWTRRVHRHGMGVIVAATLWGVAIIGFGIVPGLIGALVFLALAGACRRDERRVPPGDLEPDDPGLASRPAGVDRAAELFRRADAGQLRGRRRRLHFQCADLGGVRRRPLRDRLRALRGGAAGVSPLRRTPVASERLFPTN